MIANGEGLDETAQQICKSFEAAAPHLICSIVSVDRAGLIHPLAAPGLPADYCAALDGLLIGPEVGSCGTAAYRREGVVIEDIRRDARFADAVALLGGLDLKACWSFPVIDTDQDVVAVLAAYCRDPRGPQADERELAETCVELCATALRRHAQAIDRERRATIDALTGLPNRAAWSAALANIPCDEPGSWGMFVIDLDNLKIVNDTFGHLAGDALIRAAAKRVARVMAPDPTFRLGGDEFAVIIRAPSMLADLDAAAERIFGALAEPVSCAGHAVMPSATIGGAVLGPDEATALAVNEAADFALYHAKETGRGGFVRYWPGIGSRITHRRDAIRDVTQALAEGRIEAHYQPVVRLDTGEIAGLEALCRMRDKDGAIIAAEAFHEATSDAHVAIELTGYMAQTIANDVAWWRDNGLPIGHIGLNVSMADFYTGSILQKLEAAFDSSDIGLDRLILEVSEDAYAGRRDRVVARELARLRAAGVRVALDDFGKGYASLTHVLDVPVDIIKIDRTLIGRLWPDDPGMIMIEGLIETARRLGIAIVAEGIETEVEASQLWAMGCELGQGFAFARAADRETMAALLRRHGAGVPDATPLYAGSMAPHTAPGRPEWAKRRTSAG
ncbi:putative bifunctional diguanylate cyclase/phosphodiesterase [Sphingopyxis indica]|uniref:Diguanylate cyclase/phosphodiesterase n=1 Tax=Sphingopyxis indica TaxID=436663 RepID=A0A239ILH2_9SPHN|nr:sensor domain-containing phosphodiesterase [Sphingopyxis indica]SNS94510.1 diguanylate cyclase/phosphodiesterase [Sphingopyxis indica]